MTGSASATVVVSHTVPGLCDAETRPLCLLPAILPSLICELSRILREGSVSLSRSGMRRTCLSRHFVFGRETGSAAKTPGVVSHPNTLSCVVGRRRKVAGVTCAAFAVLFFEQLEKPIAHNLPIQKRPLRFCCTGQKWMNRRRIPRTRSSILLPLISICRCASASRATHKSRFMFFSLWVNENPWRARTGISEEKLPVPDARSEAA